MRMSDWSSDVCSSDLCSAGRATYASKLWPSSAVNFTVSPIPVSLSLGGSLCTAYANVAAEGRFLRSHVEAKVKDIAVLDDVVLALGAHLAGLLGAGLAAAADEVVVRSEEHTSELQSLMRISYAVFCLKKRKPTHRK